ncbi:MAG: arginyltransferase [Phycisphaerales bacterium]|nr:arginyltransferase [Phycisphaerales bacterium]
MTEQSSEVRQSAVQVLHTLPESPPHACAYLPGQVARDRGFGVHRMQSGTWQTMLESGWRRSGMTIYEPACPFCSQCKSLRIPVGAFAPDRTMRRLARLNCDLSARLVPVTIDDERYDLYRRYIRQRHDGMMTGSRREFELFLGQSPVDTCELELRLEGRLICVGTIDRTPAAWSCVYCYFDPELPRRSLGTYNIFKSIEFCARHCPAGSESRLYLGYWVDGSKTMAYKARFRPHEVLEAGRWRRVDQHVPWDRRPTVELGPALRIHEGSVSSGASSSW